MLLLGKGMAHKSTIGLLRRFFEPQIKRRTNVIVILQAPTSSVADSQGERRQARKLSEFDGHPGDDRHWASPGAELMAEAFCANTFGIRREKSGRFWAAGERAHPMVTVSIPKFMSSLNVLFNIRKYDDCTKYTATTST